MEFAIGTNDKGRKICFTYRSTKHFANFHKDDKSNSEQKKPNVHAIRTTRKKGHERMAEKVWDLSDSENE